MEEIANNVFLNLDNGMIYFVIEGETEDGTEEYFVMTRITPDELIRIGNTAKCRLDMKDLKDSE